MLVAITKSFAIISLIIQFFNLPTLQNIPLYYMIELLKIRFFFIVIVQHYSYIYYYKNNYMEIKMDSQSGEQGINEVIPSITLALDSLKRAEQEYRNGQQTRESRIDTIYQNANNLTSIYFSPTCEAILNKINKYYQFTDEEFEQLLLSLEAASTNAQNMITFQSVWKNYENQLQDCISQPTAPEQQGESPTP